MRLALDTNKYTDLVRGDAATLATLNEADEICIPFVVLAELEFGFRRGSQYLANRKKFDQFVAVSEPEFLWADRKAVEIYANLRVQLHQQGTPIPENDIWIAALTMQHGLALYTRDAHFNHLPQLVRV